MIGLISSETILTGCGDMLVTQTMKAEQEDCCKFETSLVLMASFRPTRDRDPPPRKKIKLKDP